MANLWKRTLKRALDYETSFNQNPPTLNAMFVVATLKFGVMKTKQHVQHVVLSGNDPILLQRA